MDRANGLVGVGGASVVGVTFGMARYAFGSTLPGVRSEFGPSEQVVGQIAGGTFAGYFIGRLGVPWLTARRGARAPRTVGAVCGMVGCAVVALPPPQESSPQGQYRRQRGGLVWAPYSDIVTPVVPPRHRASLLPVIATGTSAGLVALAGLGLLT